MKVIQAHNFYKIKGGEDVVVATEKQMLETNGHEVVTYYKYNNSISTIDKLKVFKESTWSKRIYNEFFALLKAEKPDVCHVHNTLPLITPSIFSACYDANIPVVLTLHNYRLICTNGLLMRNGGVCEDCLGDSAYKSVLKKCYRNSVIQTYAVAKMIEKNKLKGIWNNQIDAFICLSDFAKNKFIQHGIPSNKLIVKRNSVTTNILSPTYKKPYFLYVGRLEINKGVQIFKRLHKELKIPIKIIGVGVLKNELENIPYIELLGKKSHEETLKYISESTALIMPSISYEGGLPLTILEAFSLKTPIIASNIGAVETMISHQKNGLVFTPKSSKELLSQLNFVLNSPEKIKMISNQAYIDYTNLYSKETNYTKLLSIYNQIIKAKTV